MSRSPEPFQIFRGGTTLRGLDWPGDGQPILALHGMTGNAREWDGFAAALAGRRVVALDLRGHGESDWAEHYSPAEYLSDIEFAIERYCRGPVILLGHSLGAILSMRVAADRPDLVELLAVVDAGPELPPSAVEAIESRSRVAAAYPDPDSAYEAIRAANRFAPDEAIRNRVAHGFVERSPGCWVWRHDPKAEKAQAVGGLFSELWDRWNAVGVSTLVVRGQESPYLPAALGSRMRASRPNVELVEVAGAGHNVATDQPIAFHSAVSEWLRVRCRS